MHSVSLVNDLTFRFPGNLNQRALALGDVDHDGDNEFVIGNLSGLLAVFKGPSETPEYICSGLGTLTAVAVGDVHNHGKNSVVCTNAEGQCHIFDWPDIHEASVPLASTVYAEFADKTQRVGGSRSQPSAKSRPCVIERPNFTIPVPVNIARILIGDIDGDGRNEIVLGRTDRILHSYRLHSDAKPAKPNRVSPGQTNEDENHTTQENVSSRHLRGERTSAPPSPFSNKESHGTTTTPPVNTASQLANRSDPDAPFIVETKKWCFEGQLGSLALTAAPETGTPLLLVAQPGGNMAMIDHNGEKLRESSHQWSSGSSEDELKRETSSTESHDHDYGNTTLEVATEIIGGVRRRNSQGEPLNELIGMITMDGIVTLLDLHAKSSKLWDLQVSHKLFALAKIDCSGDGRDCIVACAWDGATFTVDEKLNVVHYQFPERVCAFTAGEYAVQPGKNTTCLFYVNFEDEISVISDSRTRCVPFRNLVDVLKDDIKEFEDVVRWKVPDFDAWNHDHSRIPPAMAEFLHTCLYDRQVVSEWEREKARLEMEIEKLEA